MTSVSIDQDIGIHPDVIHTPGSQPEAVKSVLWLCTQSKPSNSGLTISISAYRQILKHQGSKDLSGVNNLATYRIKSQFDSTLSIDAPKLL